MPHATPSRFLLITTFAALLLAATATRAQTPNDPLYPQQQYLNVINASDIWSVTTGDPTVKIAVIGGGNVLPGHEDLETKTSIFSEGSYNNGAPIPSSREPATATAVGGVAAAITNNGVGIAGLNWNAPVLSYNPSTLPGTEHLFNIKVSPDGERVALIRKRTPGVPSDPRYQLWIVDRDGSNPRLVSVNTGTGRLTAGALLSPWFMASTYSHTRST